MWGRGFTVEEKQMTSTYLGGQQLLAGFLPGGAPHDGLQLVAQLLLLPDLQVALHHLLAGLDEPALQQLHLLDQIVRGGVAALQLPPPT